MSTVAHSVCGTWRGIARAWALFCFPSLKNIMAHACTFSLFWHPELFYCSYYFSVPHPLLFLFLSLFISLSLLFLTQSLILLLLLLPSPLSPSLLSSCQRVYHRDCLQSVTPRKISRVWQCFLCEELESVRVWVRVWVGMRGVEYGWVQSIKIGWTGDVFLPARS